MKTKTLLLIIGSVVAIFILLFVVYKMTNNPAPSIYPEINVIKSEDHLAWSAAKKYVLVEYSDFQCPACRDFHLLLNQMVATGSADAKIKEKVTLVFRHFPLNFARADLHPNSPVAAYAAEAAGRQNKFFEMANLLFEKQEEWKNLADPRDFFVKLAAGININTDRFKLDIDSQEIKDKVRNDFNSGNRANVQGTPSFFLNGQKLENIRSFDQFKSLLLNLE